MKKFIILFLCILNSFQCFAYQQYMHLFDELNLHEYTTKENFANAVDEYLYYGDGSGRLGIINYSKHINDKKFIVINIIDEEILYIFVSPHGQNSGNMYAKSFSNKVKSKKTSLGTLVLKGYAKNYVKDASWLKYPNAAKAQGVSKGKNDNSWKRAIVFHAASYANLTDENLKKYNGRVGRSHGCPVVPETFYYNGKLFKGQDVVDYMVNGGVIYSHI